MTLGSTRRFRARVNQLGFKFKNAPLITALRGWQSDYRRFIILGRGRTGSNFLRGLLNSHSQIVVFGELFRFYDSIGWEFPDYDKNYQSARLIHFMQNDPTKFLNQKVFNRFPKGVLAVGFKLFYYHAQDERRALWKFLVEQKDIGVIHVKRENTLRMILSEKIAFLTDHWTNTTGEEEGRVRVYLDYEECQRRFESEKNTVEEFDTLFREHPHIEVTYEALSLNYCEQMEVIQKFLGVRCESLTPRTYKQSKQPLMDAILNYYELKQAFQQGPWKNLFED